MTRSINLNRKNRIKVSFTDEELKQLDKKHAQTKIVSREAFMRKMLLQGEIKNLDLSPLLHIQRLLGNSANNINQIAKRANETRNIYELDIIELRHEMSNITKQVGTLTQELIKSLK